ncbi:MAG: septation protein IspZ, partial [Parvularculaceae bacterium]|nr:septation protein IspZ [Parvularculaceae bacterium]
VAVLTLGLGVMTLILQDKRFTYMKPTFVYSFMAIGLGGGLMIGQNFLKMLFDGALEMAEDAWRTLTWRFVAFNVAAALSNEVLWRTLTADCVQGATCSGESVWLWIKGIGFTAAYLIFMVANAPFLMKHAKLEGSDKDSSS